MTGDEWYNWNFLLPKRGRSQWGWEQNALVELDPQTRTVRYTPEYYAVKHFSNLIGQGAEILGYDYNGENRTSVLVAKNPDGKYVAVAGNFSDTPQPVTVEIAGKYLNVTLPSHSFNTFTTVR